MRTIEECLGYPAPFDGFYFASGSPACDKAVEPSPGLSSHCLRLHQLWMRYETAHCPNQTGQRAQPPLLHLKMAGFYQEQVKVAGLAAALRGDEGGSRTEAAERLRSLVSTIVLTPADSKLTIDVHGDLAGILTIAQANALSREVGDGTDPRNRLRMPQNSNGRPLEGAAVAAELAKQVKLVAGACNHRDRHSLMVNI
jgi:hypothetical protein